jgi:hypothetical protein
MGLMSNLARPHRFLALGLVVGLAAALAACGSSSATPNGVASLSGNGDTATGDGASTATTQLSAQDKEAALLKYVQCLRENGMANLSDPQFDSNGNLQFGRGGAGGAGGGGAGGGAAGGAGATQGTIDRSAFQSAQKACGPVPAGALGNFNRDNLQAIQDASLKYAKCMRDKGFDVPDPDFSQLGQPGTGGGAGGGFGAGRAGGQGNGANQGGGRGLFGNLDRNDPKVQAAAQDCRSAFTDVPGFGGGQGGGPGGGNGGGTPGGSTGGSNG